MVVISYISYFSYVPKVRIFPMLQTQNRLTKVRDFNLLLKYGRWVSGAFIDFKFLPLAKAGEYFPLPKRVELDSFKKQLKLAITVGLKISKSAVQRNRVKRQMREVLRLKIKDTGLREGYYGMLVAKKGVLDKDYGDISQEIELLLNKSNILIKK